MKLVFLMSVALFALSAQASDGYHASDGYIYPWCTENAIDPNNDGWGWENEASCKVPAKPIKQPARGVDEMPKNSRGLPTYGSGRTCGNYGVLGKGRGHVCCNGKFFHNDEDDVTFVIRFDGKRYGAKAGSDSCARNKVIMHCAFENPLAVCEANARRWY